MLPGTWAREHLLTATAPGTFEYVWYERRPSLLIVRDAHSLYAESLGEIGIVGSVCSLGALVAPLVAAVRGGGLGSRGSGSPAFVAWVTAAALDWHWEMVGVTIDRASSPAPSALLAAERGVPARLAAVARG